MYNVEFNRLYYKALTAVIEEGVELFAIDIKLDEAGRDVMDSLCNIKLHEIECAYRSKICNAWQRSMARQSVYLIKARLKGW